MNFVCSKQNLIEGLNIVQKRSSTKTTMPILEGLLIEVLENEIKLTSNDLEIGIECTIPATVLDKGSTVVETKMFSEIIRKLPDDNITIFIDEKEIFNIECEGSFYKLSKIDPDEFPAFPEVKSENKIIIEQNKLKELIRQTIFAISMDENRAIFTGCLLEAEGNEMTIVGVDGFRLALNRVAEECNNEKFSFVIPGKTLNEIAKILQPNDTEVKISVEQNQILFEMDNCRLASRLLEGTFLDYRNAIPIEKDTSILVNKTDLLNAFERIYILVRDDKKYPAKINISDGKLNITCNSTVGNAKEDIKILEFQGNELEIGFNPKYFIDALKVIDDDEIVINFTSSIAPCVIVPAKGNRFAHMILPVRLKQE